MDIYSVAYLVFFAGHIVVTIYAFRDETFSGVMCLFVPLYLPYYAIRRIHVTGRELFLLIYLGCFGLLVWKEVRPYFAAVNPCDLVTKGEAGDVLGATVRDPLSETRTIGGSAVRACLFVGDGGSRKQLGVALITDCPSLSGRVKDVEEMRPSTTLKDAADEAYVRKGKVYARKGKTCILVITEGGPDSVMGQIATERLTGTILKRLGSKTGRK